MILPVQKSEICCHLDLYPGSQPQNVLKMFLGFQEIEPVVLMNVFLYNKRSVVFVSTQLIIILKRWVIFQVIASRQENKTSMCVDVLKCRQSEVDFINGRVVALAKR